MNDSGNTTETIPIGQRLFDRPFLLLAAGLAGLVARRQEMTR